ncbi:MAG TPA: bifunctional isocitrate dehydrogenase kinase/phosphatase [Candidatus Dormibacteraeota bacterium]
MSRLSAGLAQSVAAAILAAYQEYVDAFAEITAGAKARFERRDWMGQVRAGSLRLDLYTRQIDALERDVRRTLAAAERDAALWAAMKASYSGLIAARSDRELAETFFNSLTRRIFTTVGVDQGIEFVDTDFAAPPPQGGGANLVREYPGPRPAAQLIAQILHDLAFDAPFRDLEGEAELAAAKLGQQLVAAGHAPAIRGAEVVRVPFLRRKGAYIFGRLFLAEGSVPLALALLNGPEGISIDAVLTDEDDVSIVFSFTRSHFLADIGPAYHVIRYLKQLLPMKPVAELYIALGHHKHGKTELYRAILRYLRETSEQFDLVPGTPGMVMVVFGMPGHDVVFKVIRDRFPAIKPVNATSVRQNYRLVFHHDRAGRLVEAQEFEHLEFERGRFTERLLDEFERDAEHAVAVREDSVVLHHVYIERRVLPLDVYLAQAPETEAMAAVDDFGQAVKDLAANNIFPGELLPKNFGLTRHLRVVCYDYDELGLLTDFSFRELPEASSEEDAFGEEAWFGVGPRDVFPAELARFLTLPPGLRAVLDQRHPDLYEVEFWRDLQDRVRTGEIIDIYPYSAARRLQVG